MTDRRRFWPNKCVIITGASSGIGRALAELLAQRGAKVGLLARRGNVLNQLADEIRQRGEIAQFAEADVTDLDALRAAVRKLEEQLGPCDVMIANAGIYRKTAGRHFDPAVANTVIATNLQGVVNAFGVVLPEMTERKSGHLVAVASIAGMLGLPGAAAYSASKAAVIRMAQSLRVDLRPIGVKVVTVCPGYVDTPLLTDEERATIKGLLSAEETARRIAKAVERGRPETYFPWHTRLLARIGSWLPPRVYDRVMVLFPEMEDTDVSLLPPNTPPPNTTPPNTPPPNTPTSGNTP